MQLLTTLQVPLLSTCSLSGDGNCNEHHLGWSYSDPRLLALSYPSSVLLCSLLYLKGKNKSLLNFPRCVSLEEVSAQPALDKNQRISRK